MIVRTAFAIIAVAAAVATAGCASASRQSMPLRVDQGGSIVSLGDYDAWDPPALSALPDSVQRSVNTYMIDRLGEEYFARLEFVGGQVVDSARMYREDPDARNYERKIFGYRLGWRLRDPVIGIDSYVGFLTLDWSGLLMSDVEFPPVRREPSKASLVPVAVAVDTARRRGMRPDRIEIDYLPSREALIYELEQMTESVPLAWGKLRLLSVEAHSGRVVRDTVVRVNF